MGHATFTSMFGFPLILASSVSVDVAGLEEKRWSDVSFLVSSRSSWPANGFDVRVSIASPLRKGISEPPDVCKGKGVLRVSKLQTHRLIYSDCMVRQYKSRS